MNHYRSRVVDIAVSQIGVKGGQAYSDSVLWCGAFVCWVLERAGLYTCIPTESKPGKVLCGCLEEVPRGEPGDIVRWGSNSHCAIIVEENQIVHGGMNGDPVRLSGVSGRAPMTVYSIQSLIDLVEVRGAETGEVG